MNSSPTPSALLDLDGLAARLRVSRRFVRRLVAERRIPYCKIGRFVRFDPDEVERWIAETRIGAEAPTPPARVR